jgi:hypothetical protein
MAEAVYRNHVQVPRCERGQRERRLGKRKSRHLRKDHRWRRDVANGISARRRGA